jgi:Trans-aconitate methyltransferase
MKPSAGAEAWFKIGEAPGLRFLKEQLEGLVELWPLCRRARVLDLGCAEGLLGKYLLDTIGADLLHGVEVMPERVAVAAKLCEGYFNARFAAHDLNDLAGLQLKLAGLGEIDSKVEYDVTLLLAILHKLREPAACLRWVAERTARAIAVRMPGPERTFLNRHTNAVFNPFEVLKGWQLISEKPGPRNELTLVFKR